MKPAVVGKILKVKQNVFPAGSSFQIAHLQKYHIFLSTSDNERPWQPQRKAFISHESLLKRSHSTCIIITFNVNYLYSILESQT